MQTVATSTGVLFVRVWKDLLEMEEHVKVSNKVY